MVLEINRDSNTFIYEQLELALYNKIIKGELRPGDMIPSVREVARHNGINPNTVQKAYRELERQGYIYTQSGMGTFVADKKGIRADDAAMTKAEQGLEDAFKQLLYLGVDFDAAKDKAVEIMNRIRKEGVVI